VLQKAGSLLLNKLGDHVTENSSNSIEPFICGANIVQPMIIEEYLLHNEYGDRLAELRASFHDSEAKRDDLCREKEVDHIGGIVLDKGTNDSQRGQSQIFEGPRFRGSIQEWVEEEWDVCYGYQWQSYQWEPYTYHSETRLGFRYEMLHIVEAQAHCRLGWTQQL
jgi:hypothetical protein